MRRYWGIGLTLLLVAGALLLPWGWFALRDASTMGSIHGETLDPLTVTQLDRSYERDLYNRLCAYLEASAADDVVCSQKDIDQEEESLWANISQAKESVLMIMLADLDYYVSSADGQTSIESCTQYVLMRKSDGQILLVANYIRLLKEDGSHTELLIDGVDGTVYYMESEESRGYYEKYGLTPWMDWTDPQALEWMWLLRENYQSEVIDSNAYTVSWQVEGDSLVQDVLQYTDLYIRVKRQENKQIYCCLLFFGNLSDSWTMELEEMEGENFGFRRRFGLYQVIRHIPELAEKAALTDYWSLTSEEEIKEMP